MYWLPPPSLPPPTHTPICLCQLLLGDVIISLPTAQRQADERGHSLLDELRILFVHGLLHLLGYDHEEAPGAHEQEDTDTDEETDEDGGMIVSESGDGAEEERDDEEEEDDDDGGMEVRRDRRLRDVEAARKEMAEEEQRIMRAMGWEGEGLIAAMGGKEDSEGERGKDGEEMRGGVGVVVREREGGFVTGQSRDTSAEVEGTAAQGVAAAATAVAAAETTEVKKHHHHLRRKRQQRFKLLLCDMDGET